MPKLLVALVSALAAVILTEGLYSLCTNRSLRSLISPDLQERYLPTDADRIAAAARTPGMLRVHPDPRVGYVTKANSNLEMVRAAVHTDQLGMRVRPGPEPTADAVRIVVLGDSVAFGQGLEDQETVAHRLETVLNEVRGPDLPLVIVHTVAVPGWNYRNSIRFLLDHLDIYQPDVVVFMPIRNDLNNTYGVTEAGRRRAAIDVASTDPWLPLCRDSAAQRKAFLSRKRRGTAAIKKDELGPLALRSDLSRESQRRFDDMAATVITLKERLERTGARLLLLPYLDDSFLWHLRTRLHRSEAGIPEIPGFIELLASDTLGFDPHPNASTAQVLAVWTAEFLLGEGHLDPGLDNPLPQVGGDVQRRRAPKITRGENLRRSLEARESETGMLRPVVDVRSGEGLNQVYAGLSAEGRTGSQFLALLPGLGPVVEVQLRPLGVRPDLYPLTIQVELDGQQVGSIALEADPEERAVVRSFRRPAGAASSPFEVRLRSPDWVVVQDAGRSAIASVALDWVRVVP